MIDIEPNTNMPPEVVIVACSRGESGEIIRRRLHEMPRAAALPLVIAARAVSDGESRRNPVGRRLDKVHPGAACIFSHAGELS